MSSRINFIFRCQPEHSCEYGALLDFINRETEMPKKELILTTLACFWLPFALDYRGNISKEDLRKRALFAVYKLKLHIYHILNSFDIAQIGDLQEMNSKGSYIPDFSQEDSILNNLS